jgi:hypothetical protein
MQVWLKPKKKRRKRPKWKMAVTEPGASNDIYNPVLQRTGLFF